ncbi:CD99 antigen-like protein 2 isoform X2 [Pleuronectes platessa]|uniref:CD99 antigen-like protein 2 isoform X2 n=1 Tax=Pleuronectes platessa TaxID=8262 RepID=UPI00232A5950|nr:CD99 antigen-like protein 2 isoform X2 [Pleuronectes platessa]
MTTSFLWNVGLLLALLLPTEVLSQGSFDLNDALDVNSDSKSSTTPAPKPAIPAGGELDLEDFFKVSGTTKAPPRVIPKGSASTKAPVKHKPKPDIFSDSDLSDVSKDDTYKPDKGKGGFSGGGGDLINQHDDNHETTAEVGTIAGIVSAVAMALVGAISSYISYQKKKLCFSVQQSLNTDMVKAENPEAVVATEPQVQQTLLEPSNAEPPTEENAV